MSSDDADISDTPGEAHICAAGYYCGKGSFTDKPTYAMDTATENYGPCPKGNYCPANSVTPTKCPIGTYSNGIGNTNINDCLPCDPGYYCATQGLSLPTGLCDPGYVCDVDLTTSNPIIGSTSKNPSAG